jgi:hypothetical protein
MDLFQRLYNALGQPLKTLFSFRIIRLVGAFISWIILQIDILRPNP